MQVEPEPEPVRAFGELIRSQRATLVRVARREGLDAEDAVECAHDACCTFLRLLQKGEAPASVADWASYLLVVTRNVARNQRRRHHRTRPHDELVHDAALDVAGEERPFGSASVEALVEEAEQHVRLRACIDRLCATQKSVVTLRLLEERDGEDVAALLGVRRGYVDVLLHRARSSLRACMQE